MKRLQEIPYFSLFFSLSLACACSPSNGTLSAGSASTNSNHANAVEALSSSLVKNVDVSNLSYIAPGDLVIQQNQSVAIVDLILVMQSDGNLVIYQGSTALWSTQTGGQNCGNNKCQAVFQTDGNFVVYDGSVPLWSSKTGGNPTDHLVLSATAPYIEVQSASNSILWASSYSSGSPPTQAPVAQLPSSDIQITGQIHQGLSIPLGSMYLAMQTDGNLVLYSGSTAVWASGSQAPCGTTNQCNAVMQSDGNWVVYNGAQAIWSSGTGGNPGARLFYSPTAPYLEIVSTSGSTLWASSYVFGEGLVIEENTSIDIGDTHLTMQSDGNLVLYQGATPIWSSGTSNPGVCGSNECHANFQSDGNFVVYGSTGALWASGTAGNSGATLTLSGQQPYLTIKNSGGTNIYALPLVCSELSAYNGSGADASGVLQNCINKTLLGQELELPAGNFTIANQVLINGPLQITTQGASQSNCYTQSAACAEFTASSNIYANTGFIKIQANSVSWDHIIVNGNKTNRYNSRAASQCTSGTNIYGSNISFAGNNITITNSVFENALCGSGFYIISGSNFNISNNTITSNGDHSQLNLWSDGMTVLQISNSSIKNNQIINNTDVDMVMGGCPNCTIQSNTVTHSNSFSSSSYGALIIQAWPNGDTTGDYEGTDISSNSINCSSGHRCGFGLLLGASSWYTSSAYGGTVHDNNIANAQQGFAADLVTGFTIYNNQVSGSGGLFWSSCEKQINYSAYDITPGTTVNRSQDKTPSSSYSSFSLTGCIPNAYDHAY